MDPTSIATLHSALDDMLTCVRNGVWLAWR
jgi:hypothetical protein